ncbi:hypothetical protein R3W88_026931 [Solanum pinnatisectum]|uniref:Uncharacterized protein n=1 Tax=Solanum pinnatisectum TaxID=50273 RepID=A0AAV9LID9_9SOLN|nr:hypothetical protein R3W88_026931 [Solanum pinnatisectum]
MENQRRRGVRKTWNPTNRRFTKKANEVINDKAVTPIKGINSNNIFATLIVLEDGERDAQELDKDKKKLLVEQDKASGSIAKTERKSIANDDIEEGRFLPIHVESQQDLTKRDIERKFQPIEQLHALISHQDLNDYAERRNSNSHDNLVEDKEEESGSSEVQLCKEDELSPQAINKSRKGKSKNDKGDKGEISSKPTRVHAKKVVKFVSK